MRCVIVTCALLAGCAAPIEDLRQRPPTEVVIVERPIACLFAAAVEHVSGYSGATEPVFTYSPTVGRTAWLRQPLTLVELEAVSPAATQVRLSQTSSARAMGQGQDLLRFVRSAPACPTSATPTSTR